MSSVTIEYAIIVRSKTRLEALIERFNTKAQTKFYIESLGGNFEDYEREHEIFYQSLSQLQAQLSTLIKHKTIDRSSSPTPQTPTHHNTPLPTQNSKSSNTSNYSQLIPIFSFNHYKLNI